MERTAIVFYWFTRFELVHVDFVVVFLGVDHHDFLFFFDRLYALKGAIVKGPTSFCTCLIDVAVVLSTEVVPGLLVPDFELFVVSLVEF